VTVTVRLNGTGTPLTRAPLGAAEAVEAAEAPNSSEKSIPIWRASSLASSAVNVLSGAVESLHAAAESTATVRANGRERRATACMGEIS
jgi:hypothetical protein